LDVIAFTDGDDTDYFIWMGEHPAGFVLNTERRSATREAILHQSNCGHIRPGPTMAPGAFTGRDYIKVCSDEVNTLLAWTQRERPQATLRPCQTCGTAAVLGAVRYPDEVDAPTGFTEVDSPSVLWEGARRQVWVNAVERNSQARQQCLAHYGARCSVCGFDFGQVYGVHGAGYMHVHHLRPLATTTARYQVDPVQDLRPVCPNCHAMIHRYPGEPCSIEALQEIMAQARQQQAG